MSTIRIGQFLLAIELLFVLWAVSSVAAELVDPDLEED